MKKRLLPFWSLCLAFMMSAPLAFSQGPTQQTSSSQQGKLERLESVGTQQDSHAKKTMTYQKDKLKKEELKTLRAKQAQTQAPAIDRDRRIAIKSRAPQQTAISTFPWTENFEGTFPWAGWTILDVDNDGYTWSNQQTDQSGNWTDVTGYNGTGKCAASASYYNMVGALTPNNWLISPALQLPIGNFDLKFMIGNVDASYFADHYEVKVSTTGINTTDFTTIYSETLPSGAWREKVISLAAYSGQTIYIAFVHNNSTDFYILKLDDVSVSAGATAPELGITHANTGLDAIYTPLHHASGMLPSATVINNGTPLTSAATFNFSIAPGSYSSTASLASLAAGATTTVATTTPFAPTATGAYTLTATTPFADTNSANNTATTNFNLTTDYFAMENGTYIDAAGGNATITFGNKFTLKNADVISAFVLGFPTVTSANFTVRIYSLNTAQTTATMVFESLTLDRATAVAGVPTEFAITPQSLAAGTYLFCINQPTTSSIGIGCDGVANGAFYLVGSTGTVTSQLNSELGNLAIRVKTGQVSNLTPANNATDVAVNTTVSATFLNNITAGTLSSVSISPDPGGVNATIAGNVLTIAHNPFAYNTTYTVTIPATAVAGMNSSVVWSFATGLDPTACNTPTNLAAVPDVFTARLSWTENGAGTTWAVKYGAPGFDVTTAGTLVSGIVYDAGQQYYTLTGLTASTNYDVYVMAECGGTTSAWAGPVTFKTKPDCGSAISTFPWTEDFNDATLNECWTVGNTTGSTTNWTINTSASYAITGNSVYHTYSSGNQDGWLVTPAIAVPASSSLILKFNSLNRYPGDYEQNSVLISTAGSTIGSTDFVEVWTPATVSEAWVETTIPLTSYVGQTIYVAFRYEGNFAHAWYIDDVSIVDGSSIDISADAIVNPSSGSNLTATESVKARLQNRSTTAVSSVPIKLFLNGTLVATESVASIAGMTTVDYDFTATLDLSAVQTHNIMVVIEDPGDTNAANDTVRKAVINYGDVIIMGGSSPVTACSKSFYDDGGSSADYAATTETQTLTVLPATAGDRVEVVFNSFSSASAWSIFGYVIPGDTLFVYEGSTTSSLLGFLTGENLTTLPTFTSYASDGALTFVFKKWGNTEAGWDASLNCVTPFTNDAGVETILSPLTGGSSAAVVSARLKNFGGTAITAMNVAYRVNGGTPVVQAFSGNIAPGATSDFSFTTTLDLSAFATYTIEVYTQLTGDGNPANDKQTKVITHVDGITLYGFRIYDDTGVANDIISFSTATLPAITSLAPFTGARAAVYYDGNIYVATTTNLIKLNASTYTQISQVSVSQDILNLTYDYSTNTTFVVYINGEETSASFGSINLSTGVITFIGSLSTHLYGISATLNGTLYGVDGTGNFVSINKTTGALQVIGATGFAPSYMQSMTIDHNSGRIFWAASHTVGSDEVGDLIEISPSTGVGTNLGMIAGNAEIVGLFIPYTRVNTDPVIFDNLTVYPNPTTGLLNITSVPDNSRVDILDITGRLLSSFDKQSGHVTLNLNLSTGIYFVKVANGNKHQIEKFIVK